MVLYNQMGSSPIVVNWMESFDGIWMIWIAKNPDTVMVTMPGFLVDGLEQIYCQSSREMESITDPSFETQ